MWAQLLRIFDGPPEFTDLEVLDEWTDATAWRDRATPTHGRGGVQQ